MSCWLGRFGLSSVEVDDGGLYLLCLLLVAPLLFVQQCLFFVDFDRGVLDGLVVNLLMVLDLLLVLFL